MLGVILEVVICTAWLTARMADDDADASLLLSKLPPMSITVLDGCVPPLGIVADIVVVVDVVERDVAISADRDR